MPSMITALLRTHVFRAAHLVAVLNALRGYYVLAGSEPTISQKSEGADMSVDVSAFSYALANVAGSKGTSSNVAIDAADGTNPRIDLLYLNSSGTLTISKGTAAAKSPSAETNWLKYEAPYPADFSAVDGVLLAEIHVGAGVTTITDANIRNIAVPRKPGIFEIDFPFGDGSAVLTAGQLEFMCPVAGKITRADVWEVGLVSSSITCTLYQHAIGAAKGDAVDSFTISSDTDMTETGLSIAVAAHDILRIETSSITAAKQIVCRLYMEAT